MKHLNNEPTCYSVENFFVPVSVSTRAIILLRFEWLASGLFHSFFYMFCCVPSTFSNEIYCMGTFNFFYLLFFACELHTKTTLTQKKRRRQKVQLLWIVYFHFIRGAFSFASRVICNDKDVKNASRNWKCYFDRIVFRFRFVSLVLPQFCNFIFYWDVLSSFAMNFQAKSRTLIMKSFWSLKLHWMIFKFNIKYLTSLYTFFDFQDFHISYIFSKFFPQFFTTKILSTNAWGT